jgi:uncharacterized membrane protein YozB (DUF420 family)
VVLPPSAAVAVLAVECIFAAGLIVGMFLARAGRIRLHAWVQSFVILANLPVILVWMVPTYLNDVSPYVGGYLSTSMVYLPVAMLGVGAVAEGLGIYVVLVAGTNWVPARFRFRQYKLWMRTTLVLWWTVFLLGVSTYFAFYGAP